MASLKQSSGPSFLKEVVFGNLQCKVNGLINSGYFPAQQERKQRTGKGFVFIPCSFVSASVHVTLSIKRSGAILFSAVGDPAGLEAVEEKVSPSSGDGRGFHQILALKASRNSLSFSFLSFFFKEKVAILGSARTPGGGGGGRCVWLA
jgi:hypothetical protein